MQWLPLSVARVPGRFEATSRHAATRLQRVRSVRWSTLLVQVVLVSGFSHAQVEAQCIDYGGYLRVVGSVDTPSYTWGVAISDSYTCVADGVSGLQVIDITNPQSPRIVGSLDTPGDARGVAVSGSYAYVADGASGLQVIDITNPQSPRIVGSVDTPGRAWGIAVSGDYAYVAGGASGLQVIDITNPQSPRIKGSVDTPGDAFDVAASGSYAYVADLDSGLQILPLHCPSVPLAVFLTSFTLSSSDDVVEVRWAIRRGEGGGEFRLSASRGEERWDVAVDLQPGPNFVAFDFSPQLSEGGEIVYRLLYRDPGQAWLLLAEQLLVLGATRAPTRLLDPYPNPASARVVIPFSAGRAGHVQLTVHDVAGRVVACLFEGTLRPGSGQWIWAVGVGQSGLKLAAGVYVVRLATERGVQARKVVLVSE